MELQIRVRPHKVAVVLPWEAGVDECLLAVEFLSALWGGRYCPIIPFSSGGVNRLATYWLKQMRPDVVYFLGVDKDACAKICEDSCQPYACAELNLKVLSEINQPTPLGLITAYPLYAKIIEENPAIKESNVVVVRTNKGSHLAMHIGATFGICDEEAAKAIEDGLKAKEKDIPEHCSVADYVSLCNSMSSAVSILDLGSHKLGCSILSGEFAPPATVVVAKRHGAGLALFWNVRMQSRRGSPGRALLFPSDSINDKDAIEQLVQWIAAGSRHANYCQLLSLSEDASLLQDLANRLSARVASCGVEHVDVCCGDMPSPVVVACEEETCVPVTVDGRIMTMTAPRPFFHELLGGYEYWILDLVQDRQTRRLPMEIYPQLRLISREVLNSPFPPNLLIQRLDKVRFATDSISLRCNCKDTNLQYFMPTAAELLEESLRESGLDISVDEKRTRYAAVLQVFDDIEDASRTFSGASYQMLWALLDGPLTLDELKGKAKLGNAARPKGSRLDRIDQMLRIFSPVRRRIARERFTSYLRKQHPPPDQAGDVLEYWVNREIVTQCFRMSRCPACGHTGWLDHIALGKPLFCAGCGSQVPVPPSLDVGYRLNPLVREAVKEGVGPVILAGRFLQRMTNRGFMWLPGVKGSHQEAAFDIDIVACCDGHLVFTECKTLSDCPPRSGSWDQVSQQFSQLLRLGNLCGAELVVLASMARGYPDKIKALAEESRTEGMAVVLLTGGELEAGQRMKKTRIADKEVDMPVKIDQLLPPPDTLQPTHIRNPGTRKRSF